MVLFICYPKCSTCKKAKDFLDSHGIDYEERNIKENNPTSAELSEWSRLGNIPISKLFNTSGILYREMELKNKLPLITDAEKLAILETDGMLVKRPILVTERGAAVGFRAEAWEALLQ